MANEKRLIDANVLIEFIDMGHLRNPLETCFSERDVVDMLESIPTVYAVEVVRCNECKHWREVIGKHSGKGNKYGYCRNLCGINGIAYEDSFCSYGERRNDG